MLFVIKTRRLANWNHIKLSHAWRKGLKTGMYYLRSRPAVDAIKFTVDQVSLAKSKINGNSTKEDKPLDEDSEKQQMALMCSVRYLATLFLIDDLLIEQVYVILYTLVYS